MTGHQRKAELYGADNIESAKIIVADPAKYPPNSLPGVWARLVLQRDAEQAMPATSRAA